MAIPLPPRIIQLETLVMPEDPNTQITSLEEVINRISEFMEAMKKTNKDIASRLPHRKEPVHKERLKMKGKSKMPGGQGEKESSVYGSHHTSAQSGKSSSHKGSHQAKTQTQQSDEEESRHQRSHHSWSHRSWSHHSLFSKVEDKKIKVDKDVQDLKEKYDKMAFFMENGEG